MNLITSTLFPCTYLGEEEGIKLIKEIGFDGVDLTLCDWKEDELLGDDYMEKAVLLKNLLQKNELICNQAHAPYGFVYGDPMDCTNTKYLHIVRSMEAAAYIGANHTVVHSFRVPEGVDCLQANLAFFQSLYPYCKKFGIKIALENLGGSIRTAQMMNYLLENLDPEWFIGLVDTGHANECGIPPHEFIADVLPGRLQGLHIHDNYGQKDNHLVPGLGTIDWDLVINALAERNYPGDFSLEDMTFCRLIGQDLLKESLNLSYLVGRRYANRLEEALKGEKK